MRKVLAGIGLGVLAADLYLVGTGRISGPVAVAALLAGEFLLFGLFLLVSHRQSRRLGVPLTQLVPPLRLVTVEAGAWADLWRLFRGRVVVPEGAVALPARQGIWQLPVMFSAAVGIEIMAVELLLPWPWVRLVLLILSLYSLPLFWGFFAARSVRPHYIDRNALVLRHGRTVVARVPRASVDTVTGQRRFDDGEWAISDEALMLGSSTGTNVTLTLRSPVSATAQRWFWQSGQITPVRRIHLWLDEPGQLVISPS